MFAADILWYIAFDIVYLCLGVVCCQNCQKDEIKIYKSMDFIS